MKPVLMMALAVATAACTPPHMKEKQHYREMMRQQAYPAPAADNDDTYRDVMRRPPGYPMPAADNDTGYYMPGGQAQQDDMEYMLLLTREQD